MKIQRIQKNRSGPTQIAFGIGSCPVEGNEPMWKMFKYCLSHGVVPNVTINGYIPPGKDSRAMYDRLARTMGAVAVSRYNPSDICYDAVKELTDRDLTQVNIHQVVYEGSYDDCLQLVKDRETDPRLSKLNAIVFLMLKPKGRAEGRMVKITPEHYENLVRVARASGRNVGFDSCSAPSFLKVFEKDEGFENLHPMVDACESGLFSLYINVQGEAFPCSFTEGTPGWEKGINLLEVQDFTRDVWNHPRMVTWREQLLRSNAGCQRCSLSKRGICRSCPVYDVDTCRELQ